MKKLNSILLSYDTLGSIVLTCIICFFLPQKINIDFTIGVYTIAISVLSIVFSLFFAALAIIMSAADSGFISFMEKKGKRFTFLLFTFKTTLLMLFISLAYAIVIRSYSDYLMKCWTIKSTPLINKSYFLFFVLLFTYSLLSTALSIKDTFMFSKYRLLFIESEKERLKLISTDKTQPSL